MVLALVAVVVFAVGSLVWLGLGLMIISVVSLAVGSFSDAFALAWPLDEREGWIVVGGAVALACVLLFALAFALPS